MMNFYIESYGCSANFSEGEGMAGLLEEYEFKMVHDPSDAYIVIINVCTVKGDFGAIKHVRELKEKYPDKKFIVAGCITNEVIEGVRSFEPDASFVSTNNITKIVSVVEETINDNPISLLAFSKDIKVNLPRLRKNKIISIIPILNSCNGTCSFCSVHIVKGPLVSYPMEEIISEARKAIIQGCKEIWITSQDNACYGLDQGGNKLCELLEKICAIPGLFKIRLGMMNPDNVLPIMDDLISVYKNDKMFKFFHLCIQAGDDKVLEDMRRKYTVSEFVTIVEKFKSSIPDLTLATDIIVGFPGESRLQFSNTVDLVKKLNPEIINISRFQPRNKTPAAKMEDQVDGAESKNRSTLLTSIFGNISYMRNERWYKWKGPVLIEEKGKEGTYIGRNFAYKQVIVEGEFTPGETVDVEIDKITKFYLVGKVTA